VPAFSRSGAFGKIRMPSPLLYYPAATPCGRAGSNKFPIELRHG
jgi:hypothetical protein